MNRSVGTRVMRAAFLAPPGATRWIVSKNYDTIQVSAEVAAGLALEFAAELPLALFSFYVLPLA